jgi:hypothetical protein
VGSTELKTVSSLFVRNDRLHRANQEILGNQSIGTYAKTKGVSTSGLEQNVTSYYDNVVIVPELKLQNESNTQLLPLYKF